MLAEAALAEYDIQTKASQNVATAEAAKHATMLVVTVLVELKAAPKLRYGGSPLTHFLPLLTAAEKAKLDAAILDKQHCHKTAALKKALANNANEQHCNKANKQCHHKATTREKALADNACKQLCQELAICTAASAKLALAAKGTAVLADLSLPKPALAKDKQRQEETTKKQCRVDNKRVIAPVLLLDPINTAIGAFGKNGLYALLLLMPSWPRLTTTLRTRRKLRQQQPRHIQQPCCPPPPAL